MHDANALLDARSLSKLRAGGAAWRAGNDLFDGAVLERFGESLTVGQGQALGALMQPSDNDLLDVHLAGKTLQQVEPALTAPTKARSFEHVEKVP